MAPKSSVHWGRFVWDPAKESANLERHGIDFRTAAKAFVDPHCLIVFDKKHSFDEPRWFCIGLAGKEIATVRFTWRGKRVRIIGAGYWSKGRRSYEATNTARS